MPLNPNRPATEPTAGEKPNSNEGDLMSEKARHIEPSMASGWLRALRQNIVWVAVLTVLGAGAGAGASLAQPTSYEASTQMMLLPVNGKDAGDVNSTAGVAQSMISSYAQAVTSDSVLAPAAATAHVEGITSKLAKDITVTVPSGTVVLNVVVKNADAKKAADLANAIDTEFVKQAPQLMPRITAGGTILQPTILRPASTPTTPVSLGTKTFGIVGAFLGFALGMAVALWRRRD